MEHFTVVDRKGTDWDNLKIAFSKVKNFVCLFL